MNETTPTSQLLEFLRADLKISSASLNLAINKSELSMLPMWLWRYGLITLAELDQIFDWMDSRGHSFLC